MINLRNVSWVKKNADKITANIKNRSQKFKQKFKNQFEKVKNKSNSKRKDFLLGFTGVLTIFLAIPAISAIAKEIPKQVPNNAAPANNQPASAPALTSSSELINGISTAAGTICGLAIKSGSLLVGAACGVVIVIGILKAQGK